MLAGLPIVVGVATFEMEPREAVQRDIGNAGTQFKKASN
jgi:hypothetical protein